MISRLIVLIVLALLSKEVSASWTSFRGDLSNSGRSSVRYEDFLTRQKSDVKTYKTSGLIWGSAVEDKEGNIYVGSADKKMYAFDEDLNLKWSYTLFDRADSLIDSAATVTKSGLVIVPGGDGYLHALDKSTGERKWLFKADGASDDTHSTGVIVNSFEGNVTQGPNGLIYAGNDNGHMYCLDEQGNKLWALKTNMMIWSMAAFSSDMKWMVFGSLDKHLYLVDPLTGKVFDKDKFFGEVKASPSLDGNNIYFGDSQGNFYSYKVENKKLKKNWKVSVGNEVYSSAANKGDVVVFGSLDGKLYAFSKDGKALWHFNTYSPISSSPVITADDVAIFGNRNGELYALDLITGKRIFSYKTSAQTAKTNLDASPLITRSGKIINGSYSGVIYQVPFEFCANTSSSQCEKGGTFDLPDYVKNLGDGTHFIAQDAGGDYRHMSDYEYKYPEVLKLKVVVMEDGKYINNYAINPLNLNLNSDLFDIYLASDDETVNLVPKKNIPASNLDLKLKGTLYRKTHWFWDRFKYFGLKSFNETVSIKVEQLKANRAFEKIQNGKFSFFVDSLYLYQPKSLDTYIPAALDGQAFKIDLFDLDLKKKTLKAIVTPATKSKDGYQTMMEPSKVFVLDGKIHENSVVLEGKFNIAAMGGSIPFDYARFSFEINDDLKTVNEEFFMIAKCLGLKGNGDSYTFSPNLIVETCDYKLRVIAAGRFRTDAYQAVPPKYVLKTFDKVSILVIEGIDLESYLVSIMVEGKLTHETLTKEKNFVEYAQKGDRKPRFFINGSSI